MLSILFTSVAVQAQTTVLGYFPSYRLTSVIRYDKLTDIVFAFINSDTQGNLIKNNPGDAIFGFDMNKFISVRDNAANNNVKLWIALGGADPGEQRAARLSSVSGNATKRNRLVSEFVQFAIDNGCYGIDIDWEFPKTQTAKNNHLALMQALNTEIASSSNPNLQVSIAVGGEYKFTINHTQYLHPSLFTTNAHLVDKWNLMAYDLPASYGPNHSSLVDAEGCMDAWENLDVPYAKMLLGVPFYARNANRSGDRMYNQLPGNSTNYNNDLASGWYYNGKSTLEAKMDLASDKGALGILIWDLGQDRSAGNFSLLDAIDAKAATLCPVPKANLGPDKGVCAGESTILNSGVTATGGRNFVWKKDNSVIGGNAPTLSVNQAGTYTIEITQSGCTRSDEILIVTGSSVTTQNASGCNDETLTLSVNSPASGKSYIWFDAETGGGQLYTGVNYAAVFPNTTTVYVEEASDGVVNYSTTPDNIPSGKFHAWSGQSIYNYRIAQRLVVETDLTIKSVRTLVSSRSGATFNVKVQNSSNMSDVDELGPFTYTGDGSSADFRAALFDIDLNLTLTPGSYFISIEPANGSEQNYGFVNDFNEATVETDVFNLYAGMFQRQSGGSFSETDMSDAYGPFLKWEIETGANASCGRTPATATVQQCGPPAVDITSPNDGSDFPSNDSINFSASITDEGSIASVVFEIWKGGSLIATLPVNSNNSLYISAWMPNGTGTDYSLKVTATDNQSNVTVKTIAFTVSTNVSVNTIDASDVSLYPNPSNSEFTLNITGVNNYSVYVYSVSGQLVISDNVSTSSYRFGSDLNSGLYVLKVVSDSGVYQSRIIKN